MAAENPKIAITLTNNAGAQFDTAALTYTGDTATEMTLVGNGTNVEFDRSWLNAKVVALWIKSNVAATILSNSTGSPGNTLTLAAGVPNIYPINANPFGAADVTKLFITGVNFTVTIYLLLNA